jgi:hypothetical protein
MFLWGSVYKISGAGEGAGMAVKSSIWRIVGNCFCNLCCFQDDVASSAAQESINKMDNWDYLDEVQKTVDYDDLKLEVRRLSSILHSMTQKIILQ